MQGTTSNRIYGSTSTTQFARDTVLASRVQDLDVPARIHVLIVDDNSVFLKRLDALVTSLSGFEVAGLASSCNEAILLLQARKVDLLLTDLAMPGLGGLELTQHVRSSHLVTHVVIVSGHDDPEYRSTALKAGADAFLAKKDLYNQLGPVLSQLFAERFTK